MSNKPNKRSLHIVSHTHWDREWYLPFQVFRLKLVALVDRLLDIFENDPQYEHFTLDGQTIILDDYLAIRPENEAVLRKWIQEGRLIIGPWHILPDEFLVSPEATIRNLLQGDRTARKFGPKMEVGYIPDPFGHIGQMPQILRGFGIDSACVERGLADSPCEFWWESPDGSRVLVANLRDGYMNAAHLPASHPDQFIKEVYRLRDSLLPYTVTDHLLFLQGNDHMPPVAKTSTAIQNANKHLEEDILVHSSLPEYLQAIRSEIIKDNNSIPKVTGELRSSKRHHLLPGVLSTRMWIKQRNHVCENLLEKWAEPFTTWALIRRQANPNSLQLKESTSPPENMDPGIFHDPATAILEKPMAVIRQAWRILMECQPHDSICGCSIDQVHREMAPRFDQVEQIAGELISQALTDLANSTRTEPPSKLDPESYPYFQAVIIYNPTDKPRNGIVLVDLELPQNVSDFEFIDENGEILPHQPLISGRHQLINVTLNRDMIHTALNLVQDGRAAGMAIQDIKFQPAGNHVDIEVVISETGEPDIKVWKKSQEEIEKYLSNPEIDEFNITARTPSLAKTRLLARNIPGHGYRTFWVRKRDRIKAKPVTPIKLSWWMRPLMSLANSLAQLPFLKERIIPSIDKNERQKSISRPPYQIQNEDFLIEASPEDGSLTIHDKRTGTVNSRMNHFVDGGDSGDEYNYNPPPNDRLISTPHIHKIRVHPDEVQPSIEISLSLPIPKSLTKDRESRSHEIAELLIETHVTLVEGVSRIDIHTEVDNREPPIRDHRLRVHFPAGFNTDHAFFDSHFEVVRRQIDLPEYDQEWIEQPRPEKPQRAFTSVSNGDQGITIANRGLPEMEVFHNTQGHVELGLTLLRCVGWLSREDLSTRKGHAGPMIATPEAQMPGKYKFDYSVIPHRGDWMESIHEANAFNSPLKAVTTDLHVGEMPSNGSFVEVDSSAFIISSVKIAEDGYGWVLRGYNPTSDVLVLNLRTYFQFSSVAKVNLAEEFIEELPFLNNKNVQITARGHEIVTIKFR